MPVILAIAVDVASQRTVAVHVLHIVVPGGLTAASCH